MAGQRMSDTDTFPFTDEQVEAAALVLYTMSAMQVRHGTPWANLMADIRTDYLDDARAVLAAAAAAGGF
jgi:glutamate mutase epsilon subunit